MDLYIASSPSYLFTVLCLKVNENHDAPGDLILLDHFPNARAYADRLREMNLFRNTIFVPHATMLRWQRNYAVVKTHVGFKLRVVFPEIIRRRFPSVAQGRYRRYPFHRQPYHRAYAPGMLQAFLWLHVYLYKRFNCQLYLYDSGMSTRIARQYVEPTRYAKERRLGCIFAEDHIVGRYFFELTGVHSSLPPYPRLQQIRPSLANRELVSVMRRCFDHPLGHETMFRHSYLFLQQSFENHPLLGDLAPQQEAIWAHLEQKLPDIMIKTHPRTTKTYAPERTVQPDRGLEIYDVDCMFCEDMDEKVLFSCYSAALLVPKYCFGQEPYLVFLYKLLNAETVAGMTPGQWDEVIRRALAACYQDPSKVFIPASFAELDACLESIHQRKAEARADA